MGDLVVQPKETAIQTRKPRTGKSIAKHQAKVHAEHFPDIYSEFYKQLKKKVLDGDMDAIKMVAEIAKLTGKNAGITINNNVNQNNNNVTVAGSRDRRFENIVRQLEARDHAKREGLTSDVQDADFEEVPSAGSDTEA